MKIRKIKIEDIYKLLDELNIKLKKVDDPDYQGYCIFNNENYLLIPRKLKEKDLIKFILKYLVEIDTSNKYLSPQSREIIDLIKGYNNWN